jgi:starch-binding outer membrane protein, SusD/RagB family
MFNFKKKLIMKKFKIILSTFVLSCFLFTSCEDAYNIVQEGEINENSLKTIADMQLYLNGTYATLTTSTEIGFTGIFTDETGVGKGNGGQGLTTHRFLLNTSDGYAGGIWYGRYVTINRVNRLIRISQTSVPYPDNASDLAEYNSIIAQARALRAFAYFQLMTYFSEDLSNDNALGVVLTTDVAQASDIRPRSTNGEIFSVIEGDLDFAINNLSPSLTSYKLISDDMINALRARMYLYRKNYPLAKQYAQLVISNSGLNLTLATPVPANPPTNPNYMVYVPSNPLTVGAPTAAWNTSFYGNASTNPYRKMFNDTQRGEVIFALDRPDSQTWENIATQFTTNTSSFNGSPLFEVSRSLFNILASKPGDVRRYVNVDPTSVLNPNYATDPAYIASDVIVIDKYPGKTTAGQPLRNDLKVFRLSEMHLILAECYASEGSLNGATNSVAASLKKIRDARNFLGAQPLPNYTTATDAWADILLERRLELCFEGHRYVDLKRLGSLANVTLLRDATDDNISGVPLSIPNNDYRYTMPIPIDEINANPSIQQNPGY